MVGFWRCSSELDKHNDLETCVLNWCKRILYDVWFVLRWPCAADGTWQSKNRLTPLVPALTEYAVQWVHWTTGLAFVGVSSLTLVSLTLTSLILVLLTLVSQTPMSLTASVAVACRRMSEPLSVLQASLFGSLGEVWVVNRCSECVLLCLAVLQLFGRRLEWTEWQLCN